ncbi:hypothetical protein POTOM_051010 [Populus tomentosa]|uniref:Bifunctional inhibitor/plant lipid transfer protein/seed storage helical domain-containing protein n=1 Tax=Populus tomentosa TaxID=118781 RepID=A0A8X7YJP9_POPTO|nr:hypothetical protein POTOM_051010 [Populus tomentosa]
MEVQKIMTGVLLLLLLSWAVAVAADVDCTTVGGFLTACSTFITHGTPDPLPGSPCCDSMMSLNVIAESGNNRSAPRVEVKEIMTLVQGDADGRLNKKLVFKVMSMAFASSF